MRVLVTGSRNHNPHLVQSEIIGWVRRVLEDALPYQHRLTMIHGDAAGADQGAHLASLGVGWSEVRVPADWSMWGKAAGPRRNVEMLDDYQPDVVLAFPIGESRGTRHCMAAARDRGIPVIEFGEALA